MKCKIITDSSREEEIIIFVREENEHARKLRDKIEELLSSEEPSEIIGYSEREIIQLYPTEVCCFITESGKVFALTADGKKWQIRQRLYALEEFLGKDFIKINQSCIANIKQIKCFETTIGASLSVVFKNGYRDYVSRRQMKAIKERIGFRL